MASAAVGGLLAFAALLVAGQALGITTSLLLPGIDIWRGIRIGLLVSLAAVRTEIVVTFTPVAGSEVLPATDLGYHLVPMALTIGFVWLAARAGRRASRLWREAPTLACVLVAAAGAGVSVGIAAALVAGLASLPLLGSFPAAQLTVGAYAASAALWAGVLASVGAGAGAAIEGARGRISADVLRGGVTAYLWALGLLVIGVLVVATLEPQATRAYVDGLRGFGPAGAALFGAHVLALPAQSAVLLLPASGSCVDLVVAGSAAARLCPWTLEALRPPAGAILPLPSSSLELSPTLWILAAAPPLAAFFGGHRAGASREPRSAIVRGAGSGVVFGAIAMLGAVFASPGIVVPSLAGWLPVEISVWSWRSAGLLCLWGVVGGAIGGWVAGRAYDAPGPRPTSA
jgi:hypothetical protein